MTVVVESTPTYLSRSEKKRLMEIWLEKPQLQQGNHGIHQYLFHYIKLTTIDVRSFCVNSARVTMAVRSTHR